MNGNQDEAPSWWKHLVAATPGAGTWLALLGEPTADGIQVARAPFAPATTPAELAVAALERTYPDWVVVAAVRTGDELLACTSDGACWTAVAGQVPHQGEGTETLSVLVGALRHIVTGSSGLEEPPLGRYVETLAANSQRGAEVGRRAMAEVAHETWAGLVGTYVAHAVDPRLAGVLAALRSRDDIELAAWLLTSDAAGSPT